MRFSPTPRAAAMGDAHVALADGVAAIHYNPAGLAWTRERHIAMMYQRIVEDVGQGSLGFAIPVGADGAWGMLAQYVDFGSTRRTVISGTQGAYSGTFTGNDLALSLSYGSKLGNWGYGTTAKYYNSTIYNASASAFAIDFGVRWRAPNAPFALGLAVTNLGTEVKYDAATERLPTVFRAGLSWEAIRRRLLVTADLERVVNENWSGHAGVEYKPADMLSLRAGYDGSVEIGSGMTLGAGFTSGGLAFDYAWIPFGEAGSNHKVGMDYSF